jgi:PAS domain S-box-containing protein
MARTTYRKDGTTISVEFTIAPLRDEAGRPIGMTAIIRGFEEMRTLKRELAEATKLST